MRKHFLLTAASTFPSLKVEILDKFEEELNGEVFRMYFLEKKAKDINERAPIDSERELVSAVQRIFEVGDIDLFIYNTPINTNGKPLSPNKLPLRMLPIGESERIEGSEEE